MNPQRRRLLLGSVGAATAATLGLPAAADDAIDLHIELHAEPAEVQLRAGAATRVWRLRGKLLRGAPQAMQLSAGGYLGPIIRVHRGQRLRIDLFNALPESTIVHWHGLHVPEAVDGHPRFAIGPGEQFRYEFSVENRAGSYWFHPHPHGRTGKQIYAGMAGLFLVSDDEESALGLPGGEQDLPLVIQDRNFDDDNQFVYLGDESAAPSGTRHGMMGGRGGMGGGMMGGGMGGGMMGGGGMGSMMERMMGVLGNYILVNGQLQASRAVEPRAYRLRLLNASNTRTLKLAWSDGTPLTVIATGGGLLAAPLQRDYVMLPPADRIELWVDFAKWAPGRAPVLRSLAFDAGMSMGSMGMGGRMGAGATLADGAAFDIQRFDIGAGKAHADVLPATLSRIDPPQPQRAVNAGKPKVFEITMGMMKWGINGASFEMLGVSTLETVKLGTLELWEFSNDGGGSMMGMVMAHSMHVHGLQFRVISREVSRRFANDYASVEAGHVDAGWKDTVLVMPGERVRILLHFTDYPGLFLYHCHMLEHEDSGLMRNYLVKT
ncbi:MAG: multicopper oxidase domain-containing protein [Burkholderiales bacterium]